MYKATLVAIVMVLGAWAMAQPSTDDSQLIGAGVSGTGKADPPGQQNKTFRISGDVDGLYPGSTGSLVLRFDNPQSFAIRVTDVTVAVDGSPGCGSGQLVASPLSSPVEVPRQGSSTATVVIRMAASAPDACQGANFPLRYSGRAEKA